jgi:hypothetical protein
VKSLLDNLERLEGVLADNDFDFTKMATTDEGKELIAEAEESTLGPEFDTYLSEKCGIATDDESTDDTTPTDDTVAVDETIIPDDTLAPSGIDLGEGEEAINQFLDFYELGTGSTLTDEQRTCIVDALVDKVTGDDLNEAIAGTPSPELTQALGLAFIGCDAAPG